MVRKEGLIFTLHAIYKFNKWKFHRTSLGILNIISVLGAFAKLPKATVSFVMSACLSVRMEQLGSHWMYFHEIRHLSIFRKYLEKIPVLLKSDKNSGAVREDLCKYTVSRCIIFRMRNVSNKTCRKKSKRLFYVQKLFSENCAVYEVIRKNVVHPQRLKMTI